MNLKNAVFCTFATLLTVQAWAASPIVRACSTFETTEGQQYIQQVKAYTNKIVIRYLTVSGEIVESYTGEAKVKTEFDGTIAAYRVSLQNEKEEWLQDQTIQITDTTVRVAGIASKRPAQPRIQCPRK